MELEVLSFKSGDVGLCWGYFGYDCIFENPCFEMLYTRSCMNSMVFMGDLIFFYPFYECGIGVGYMNFGDFGFRGVNLEILGFILFL